MPLNAQEHDLYISWFHAAFPGGSSTRDTSFGNPPIHPRILRPMIDLFRNADGFINRWPLTVRSDLARTVASDGEASDDGVSDDYTPPPPFHTWEQLSYAEHRAQALPVWFTLVHFLIYNWDGYGGKERPLHRLGLEPSREVCDMIDDLRLYTTIQQQLKPRATAVSEALENFFLTVLRDPNPTVRTNPLLWWLAVLIHADNCDELPIFPFASMKNRPGTATDLAAIDHYARVLIFLNAALKWTRTPGPSEYLDRNRREVVRWVESADISWVDEDEQTPPSGTRDPCDVIGVWTDFRKELEYAINSWLIREGPMREILALKNGIVPPERPPPPSQQNFTTANAGFHIKYIVVYDWLTDPGMLSLNPATWEQRFSSPQAAKDNLHKVLESRLTEELGDGPMEHSIDDLDQVFSLGSDDCGMAVQINLAVDQGGLARARLVYVNSAENIKILAWVEGDNEMDIDN
ncbi:hypothetical protein PRZ48_011350 [Zasmidium cellare]|uniref:Uncharacterized protein n=1 Tax=Zasmidium cellare TaxID=395010 RepID=A0ABR0E6Q5_ZASCE|nr:hypothetical protein PRZ48_011350 [Zasmidium cellare]